MTLVEWIVFGFILAHVFVWILMWMLNEFDKHCGDD